MDNYRFKLTGLTPLLMHFDNIEAQDEANAKGKTGGKAGDDRYPAHTWKTYLYCDNERVVMPSMNLASSLLKVGGSISIGNKKTLKASSQALYYSEVNLQFLTKGKPVMRADVEGIDGPFKKHLMDATKLGFFLLVAACRVNKSRHIRVRPQFDQWTVEGEFATDDPDLSLERLQKLFTLAGMKSGLGDWRPSAPLKPGPYGRFQAEVVPV